MPRSKKNKSKNKAKNTRKIVGGLHANVEKTYIYKLDSTQNVDIVSNDLTYFYNHYKLLKEPNLFNEGFFDALDRVDRNVNTELKRLLIEPSVEKDSGNINDGKDDSEISVMDINLFQHGDEKKDDAVITTHYYVLNTDNQTIMFLMIIQKFKLLCAMWKKDEGELIKSIKDIILKIYNNSANKQTIKDANVQTNEDANETSGKFKDNHSLIELLKDLFTNIFKALTPKSDENKKAIWQDATIEQMRPFSVEWNENELAVLEYYSDKSNTIYGILAVFLGITVSPNSEFIEPKEKFFKEIFKKIDDYNNNSKIETILFKGKADAQNVFEELFKTMNDAINSAVNNMSDDEFKNFISNPQVSEYIKTNKQKYQTNYWVDMAKDIDDKKQKNAGELVQLASRS